MANAKHEPRNVLITGVTSTIGRHLAMALYNDKTVGLVLGIGKGERPYYFHDFAPERFVYRDCDILKHRELKNLFLSNAFKKARINTVVHLAFHNRQVRGEDVHKLNVEGTKNFLDMCNQTAGIAKFVFKSSDVVYKLRPHNPCFLDENADLNFDPGADQWIKDRVDADMICRSYMDSKTMAVVILRITNVIGRNVPGQFNAYFDSKVVFKTLGFNPMINLIHMRDVVQALTQAIHRPVRGVFNIAGRDTAPISTFAEINNAMIVSLPQSMLGPVNWIQRKLGMTDYYYSVDADRQKYACLLDIGKAKRELGFQPEGRVDIVG
jgi:UDP-glucose 4-epimerase